VAIRRRRLEHAVSYALRLRHEPGKIVLGGRSVCSRRGGAGFFSGHPVTVATRADGARVPDMSPNTTLRPHKSITSQRATQRIQRQSSPTVTHWTTSYCVARPERAGDPQPPRTCAFWHHLRATRAGSGGRRPALTPGEGLLGGLGDADDHSHSHSHSMIIQRHPGVGSHNLPGAVVAASGFQVDRGDRGRFGTGLPGALAFGIGQHPDRLGRRPRRMPG
jgi:hypothetical protein